MFDNSGEKVRGLAMVAFVLQLILAFISLIAMAVAEQFLLGIIYAAIMGFAAWVSAVTMAALGDAADYAQRAATYGYEIMRKLDRMTLPAEAPRPYSAPQNNTAAPNPAAGYPVGKVPAWKQVELNNRQNDQVQ